MSEKFNCSVVGEYLAEKGKRYIRIAVNHYALGHQEIARDFFNMAYPLFTVAKSFGYSQNCKDYLAEVCSRYNNVDSDKFLYDIMAAFVAETRMAYMK